MTFDAIENVWRDESPTGWAIFNEARTQRYVLGRRFGTGAPANPRSVAWIMINPSSAGAAKNDPTITRVVGFSRSWGFDVATVVNLFPHITSDPDELRRRHPHEPCALAANDHYARPVLGLASRIVCAWGAESVAALREPAMAKYVALAVEFGRAQEVVCLGRTKSGAPRHPLYLPKTTQLEPFSFTPITDAIEGRRAGTCHADLGMPGSTPGSERRREE